MVLLVQRGEIMNQVQNRENGLVLVGQRALIDWL